MYNILICDDEQDIVNALKIYLSGGDYCLFEAHNGREALEAVEKNDIHLILMDIMMPQLDGIAATAKLREKSNVPIILLTAKSESSDKVLGLNIGADDYIVKPFSPGEVMARIRAVLRRMPAPTGQETLVVGSLSIHLPSLSVTLDGRRLDLTRRETELLYTLASAPGRVFTRDNLLTLVWGVEHAGNYRAVDSHIKRLRQKLDAYPHDFFSIATVWGTGYKFERRLP